MKINLLGDFRKESGIEEVLTLMLDKGFRTFFLEKNYGEELTSIAVIPVCQDPSLNLKQRTRFSKKEKCLYIDLMFELNLMQKADLAGRKIIISNSMIHEIPNTIAKYKLNEFNLDSFNQDLTEWFHNNDFLN